MDSALPAYAELHCLSNFSFLRGASHPEELVARAQQLGYSALALTDECSFAGVVRAHTAARECGLPLILGSEIQLADGPQLVLLATGREGYGNLSELITLGRRRGAKGNYILETKDLDQGLPGCLALLLPGAVPDVAQARWLAERGVDAVIAQGAEAGGHRGMFLTDRIAEQPGTFALVPQVVDAVDVVGVDGEWIGRGFYNGHSRIAVRILETHPDIPVDAGWFSRYPPAHPSWLAPGVRPPSPSTTKTLTSSAPAWRAAGLTTAR